MNVTAKKAIRIAHVVGKLIEISNDFSDLLMMENLSESELQFLSKALNSHLSAVAWLSDVVIKILED